MTTPVIEMNGAMVWVEDGTVVLHELDWSVRPGEHWVILGPNGSGKSTLLSLAGAVRHPSRGAVTVLGERLGQTSLWDLRERIGAIDPAMTMHDWLTVEEVVLTGATGTIHPRWECYGPAEQAKAADLLALFGCANLIQREVATCSQGERQRVRIARSLMADPPLLILDEPATGLDLPAREALIGALADLTMAKPDLATVLVSHHLEEIPPSTTHAMLLRAGHVIGRGSSADVLTSDQVSACFGFPVEVRRDAGRWSARATAGWRRPTPDQIDSDA